MSNIREDPEFGFVQKVELFAKKIEQKREEEQSKKRRLAAQAIAAEE